MCKLSGQRPKKIHIPGSAEYTCLALSPLALGRLFFGISRAISQTHVGSADEGLGSMELRSYNSD